MAKRPAKGKVTKGNARAKASARKTVKRGVDSSTRPRVKAKSAATAKSRGAAAATQPRKGTAEAPPSTDIRRAYKSRLLAGYLGTHGADSIPNSKK